MSEEICEWELKSENNEMIYRTGCDNSVYYEGVPNTWFWCPYCGNKLKRFKAAKISIKQINCCWSLIGTTLQMLQKENGLLNMNKLEFTVNDGFLVIKYHGE